MMQNWGRPALKFSGFVLDPRPQPQFPSYHRALHCSRREPGVVSSHCLTARFPGLRMEGSLALHLVRSSLNLIWSSGLVGHCAHKFDAAAARQV